MEEVKRVILALFTFIPLCMGDCIDCGHSMIFSIFSKDQIELSRQALEVYHWAAQKDDIATSSCRISVPTMDQMKSHFEKKRGEKERVTRTVNGITFENESLSLIEAYEDLTSQKAFLTGGIVERFDFQKDLNINPGCKKVDCAVEKIFGQSLGNKLLYLKSRYEFNGSEYGHEWSSRLDEREIDSLLRGVSSYPPSRFPLEKNSRLTKFERGERLKIHSDSTIAFGSISFYDQWSEMSPEMMDYTVVHEIAHNIASELDLDNDNSWLSLSGWVELGSDGFDEIWESEKDNFVSIYGATNPAEDFAETVSAYRFRPEMLKEVSPEKYNYIKEVVFDGLEYLSDDLCQPSQSLSSQYRQYISRPMQLDSKVLSEVDYNSVIGACQDEAIDYLLNKRDAVASFDVCMNCLAGVELYKRAVLDDIQDQVEYDDKVIEQLDRVDVSDVTCRSDYFSQGKIQEVKRYLRNAFIDSLKKNELFLRIYSDIDIQDSCDKAWGEHSWQYFLASNDDLEDAIDPYRYKDQIADFTNTLCIKASREPTSAEERRTWEWEEELDYLTTTSQERSESILRQIGMLYAQIEKIEASHAAKNRLARWLSKDEFNQQVANLKQQIELLEQQIY